MHNKTKMLISLTVGFAAIATLAGCGTKTPETSSTVNTGMVAFAECISQKGIIMYGTETCPYCIKQKKLFAEAFESVEYVDCIATPDVCTQADIQAIPARVFPDGSKKEGLQTLEDLAQLSKCELPVTPAVSQ